MSGSHHGSADLSCFICRSLEDDARAQPERDPITSRPLPPEPQQTAEPCSDVGPTPALFFEQTDMVEAIPAFATKIVGDPGICLVGTTDPVVGEVAMAVDHRVTLSPVDFNSISGNRKYA